MRRPVIIDHSECRVIEVVSKHELKHVDDHGSELLIVEELSAGYSGVVDLHYKILRTKKKKKFEKGRELMVDISSILAMETNSARGRY